MPFEWRNMMVVTKNELVPTFYNCDQTLFNEITRYKDADYGIKRVQSGGNGREMLIDFYSLRQDIQNAIGDPKKITNPLETFYKTDDAAVKYFTTYQFDDETGLSLQHQEEYITNASVLRAALELKTMREHERRSKGGSLKGLMGSLCNDVAKFNRVLKSQHKAQHTLPASEKRFKETFRAFELPFNEWPYNYPSLISKKLKNSNRRIVTDNVLQMLNDLFATQSHKPTRTEVSKQYEAFLSGYLEVASSESGEIYDPKMFKPLSDSTIINYLQKWEERIGTWKLRSGDRQRLMGQFKPYHMLEKTELAGSLISVDDRQPVFFYEPGKRMWFYMGIDLGSEAFTCWVYGKSKEGIITEFYRQMVRNYSDWGVNLPHGIECESSLNSSFKNSFLMPGVMFKDVRIEANNARGKRIEAYFRQLRYTYEKQREGWLARPFARSEANQAGPQKQEIIPYSRIVEGCLRDIEDWNNSPHSVHTDKTRWEVFMEKQNPNLEPPLWQRLIHDLGYKTRTSCNAGIINLDGKKFVLGEGHVFTGDRLINAMKKVEGKNIDVYWLDGNNGQVLKAVIYIGDMYICEAVPAPTYKRAKIEQTERCRRNQEIMSAYVATIEGFMRYKASLINKVIVIDNRPQELPRTFTIPGTNRYEVPEEATSPEYTPEILPEPEDEIDAIEVEAWKGDRDLKDIF